MKIIRICYEFPEPWDGLTSGPYEMTISQLVMGNEILFLCGGTGNIYLEKNNYYKFNVIRFGNSLPLLGPFFVSFKILFYIIRNNLFNKFDIIHGHGHLPLFIHIFLLFKKKYRKKYFLHMHITGRGRALKSKFKLNFKYLLTYTINWNIHRLSDFIGIKIANKVFCVSESVLNEVCQIRSNFKPILIENGVNIDRFNFRKDKSSQWIDFLYVGVISNRKRVDTMINFLNRYSLENKKLINLTVVGVGDVSLLNFDINNQYFKLKHLGYIDYLNMSKVYHSHDVLLLFSEYEGLPKVVLEALASGLEVVSTKSFIMNDENELVHFFDFEYNSFAEVLNSNININKNPEKVKKLSWNIKTHYIQKFYEDCVNT
jgi:glycogen(starch) synthase